MCSSVERHAATIWTLSDALCEGSKELELVKDLRMAVENLAQFVCHSWDTDRPMSRLKVKLREYVAAKIAPAKSSGTNIGRKDILAYCHMISALSSDFFTQVPEKPLDRAKAWLGLTNAISLMINTMDIEVSGSQAARGCKWASEIKEILRKI